MTDDQYICPHPHCHRPRRRPHPHRVRALTLAASALAVTALATTSTISSLKLTASTLAASALTLTGTGTAQHQFTGGYIDQVRAHIFKSSHRPHVRHMFARSLQGGGVFVEDGTVTFSSCTRES